MAIPAPVSTSQASTNTTSDNLTITLGAGLSFVSLHTQKAYSLTAGPGDINNVGSGWTCLVGTHGGAPFSGSPDKGIYLFMKVTTAGETIKSGTVAAGVHGYNAITISGYDTGTAYEALATGSGSFSGSSPYTANVPALTTLGADRLVLKFISASDFASTNATPTNANLASPSTTGWGSGTTSGHLLSAYGGKAAAGSTGTTAFASTDIGYIAAGYVYAILAVKPVASTAWTQEINDAIAGTDARALGVGKAVADAIAGVDERLAAIGMVRAESASVGDAIAKAPGLLAADAIAATDDCSPALTGEVPQGQGIAGHGRRGVVGRAGQEVRGRLRHGHGGQIG